MVSRTLEHNGGISVHTGTQPDVFYTHIVTKPDGFFAHWNKKVCFPTHWNKTRCFPCTLAKIGLPLQTPGQTRWFWRTLEQNRAVSLHIGIRPDGFPAHRNKTRPAMQYVLKPAKIMTKINLENWKDQFKLIYWFHKDLDLKIFLLLFEKIFFFLWKGSVGTHDNVV